MTLLGFFLKNKGKEYSAVVANAMFADNLCLICMYNFELDDTLQPGTIPVEMRCVSVIPFGINKILSYRET